MAGFSVRSLSKGGRYGTGSRGAKSANKFGGKNWVIFTCWATSKDLDGPRPRCSFKFLQNSSWPATSLALVAAQSTSQRSCEHRALRHFVATLRMRESEVCGLPASVLLALAAVIEKFGQKSEELRCVRKISGVFLVPALLLYPLHFEMAEPDKDDIDLYGDIDPNLNDVCCGNVCLVDGTSSAWFLLLCFQGSWKGQGWTVWRFFYPRRWSAVKAAPFGGGKAIFSARRSLSSRGRAYWLFERPVVVIPLCCPQREEVADGANRESQAVNLSGAEELPLYLSFSVRYLVLLCSTCTVRQVLVGLPCRFPAFRSALLFVAYFSRKSQFSGPVRSLHSVCTRSHPLELLRRSFCTLPLSLAISFLYRPLSSLLLPSPTSSLDQSSGKTNLGSTKNTRTNLYLNTWGSFRRCSSSVPFSPPFRCVILVRFFLTFIDSSVRLDR